MLVIDENRLHNKEKSNQELKIDLAVWLYENNALSIGRAAAFCGMDWPEFIPELTKRGVDYLDQESVMRELDRLEAEYAK